MKMLKLARRALLVLLCSASFAQATTLTPNFSDLWWNPNESGWGLNISQQADVLFLTLFVYGPNNQAVWYSATLGLVTPQVGSEYVFTGDLYQTTGQFFGVPFNPSSVVLRKVGTVRFDSTTSATATLLYTIDGTSVSKQIERQTLRANSILGNYLGGTSDVTFNCTNPARNGLRTEDPGPINIVLSGSQVIITAPTCAFRGTYSQQGQTGRIEGGTYACSNNATGIITFSDIYVEQSGIIGKYSGRDSACNFEGNIGGTRRK
jgi:hypothetical protein